MDPEEWTPYKNLRDCEAMDVWEAGNCSCTNAIMLRDGGLLQEKQPGRHNMSMP